MNRLTSSRALLSLGSLAVFAAALASACSADDSKASSSHGPRNDTSAGTGGGGAGGGGAGGGLPAVMVDCTAPSGDPGKLKLTQVASGVVHPLLVKSAPGDPARLFVVSQQGQILILKDGVLQPKPFLDIKSLVQYHGDKDERGLLGFAFHPGYQQNGRIFAHFTDKNTSPGDTKIVEFKRGADADTADPTPVATVLTQAQPQPAHNGGSIEFSPKDGYLYIGLGDGGGIGDMHGTIGNGQDTGTLLGKILRLDVSTIPYKIPAGNQTGDGVLKEIWDSGFRNPYRFSFDACGGTLFIGDVGEDTWEEIDVEKPGDGRRNYGWRRKEGNHCFNPADNCDPAALTTPPLLEYSHVAPTGEAANCSVVGGYVYRGSKIPWLRGAYLYGDFCSGKIWTIKTDSGMPPMPIDQSADLVSAGFPITSFGQDGSGEIYVTLFDGRVFRIDAS